MPYFSIDTNLSVQAETSEKFLTAATAFIAEMLAKPERVVMVAARFGVPMLFGGDSEPLAFVQLKSIGLPEAQCTEYTQKICGFLKVQLGIRPDRIFVDMQAIHPKTFGWNNRTF